MRNLLLIISIFCSSIVIGQTTAIPDANFEQKLINLGFDSTPIDGTVLTSNIDTITYLDITFSNITDLTGIEGFTNLTELRCNGNFGLSTIDVSQNIALTELQCYYNPSLVSINVTQNALLINLYCFNTSITNLDVTQNSSLVGLDCSRTQLSTIDLTQNVSLKNFACSENGIGLLNLEQNINLEWLVVSNNSLSTLILTQNSALIYLNCDSNQLSSLDLTLNNNLVQVFCRNNQLSCLNVKNTNNIILVDLWTGLNPNLTCIEVDNVTYSSTNWTTIDAWSSFSTSCPNPCGVGINEYNLSNLSLYPNPTVGTISIDLGDIKTDINATLTNSLGQVILNQKYKSTDFIELDIDAPSGIYFLQLETNGEIITKKIIKK